ACHHAHLSPLSYHFVFLLYPPPLDLPSFPTRRSSDLSSSASLVWISLSITQSSTICMASVIIHDRPNSWSLRTTRSLLTRRRRSPSSGDSGIASAVGSPSPQALT